MFQRILVPLDVAQKNQTALSAAAEMARQHKATILLLHVIERIEHVPEEGLKCFYHRLEQGVQRELTAAAQSLAEQGVSASTHIVFGRRAEEVVRFAIQNQVDLIVLRSHRYDPQTATFPVGTLSHQLAVLAQCAVLLVK
jgi:nucleotide-binding universal stress UspA family protein